MISGGLDHRWSIPDNRHRRERSLPVSTPPGTTPRDGYWTGPPRGEGAVAAILLFPLRAIERARGWRRLMLLLLYVMIALPILALVRRRSQLVTLPSVANAFDVPAPQPTDRVRDDRNAVVSYQRAVEHFRDLNEAEGRS